jgi:polyhydroxyalkanoate synthesis regulator phasin
MKRVILSVILSGTLCAPLFAANPADLREKSQKVRIRQGVKSGELTRKEAKKLRKEEVKIRAIERKAKSNGDITRKEARKLDRALDKANKDIRKQKSDKQNRN